jgi:hypothetical protein
VIQEFAVREQAQLSPEFRNANLGLGSHSDKTFMIAMFIFSSSLHNTTNETMMFKMKITKLVRKGFAATKMLS